MKIKPFRGIVRNALQKKLRLRSGKYFAEDSIEDLANQILQEVAPVEATSPIPKNKLMQLRKMDTKQSFHTFISSRTSLDNNNMNSNAINLIRKFTKVSTKQKRNEKAYNSSTSNNHLESSPNGKFLNSDQKRKSFLNNKFGFNSQ